MKPGDVAIAPTFQQCVLTCFGNADFMREYRRLSGAKLGLDTRTLLGRLVDRATGHEPTIDEREARDFFRFVRDYIWAPVVTQCVVDAMREAGAVT